ncbi:MAG: bifunctional folylpolyglutamate synthase/dihydrofolate synthase [Deltaproteobacteria bacterium]|nr:bifunctional folylpolyglutamate synthase/dihydrofolate synthase [Deltaproteobacteria bacterium]
MMTAWRDLDQATAWVFNLQKYGVKFGLSCTLSLLRRLAFPWEEMSFVHLAGTNGKGSVAAMLSAVLTRAGHPVGLFTSPHLVRFAERFRLRDEDIAGDRLLALINRVRQAVDETEPPTFFEFVTAMAFLYFYEEKAFPVILETGMGGRLDATNIVRPLASVITNISLDHREFLGDTLMAVAGEKAGIIKPGVPLVTGARQKRVLDLFRERCRELEAPLYVMGPDFHARGGPAGRFSYHGLDLTLKGLATNLRGRHQYGNAALALAALELLGRRGLAAPEQAIREGLAHSRWPGRLDRMAADPRVWLDGAHNPAAAQALARTLASGRRDGRLIMVVGIMADKDVDGILAKLMPLAELVIFTRPRYFRAAEPEELARRTGPYGVESLVEGDIAAAVRRARELAGPEDRIVVTGSLFTVGEAKAYFDGVGPTEAVRG